MRYTIERNKFFVMISAVVVLMVLFVMVSGTVSAQFEEGDVDQVVATTTIGADLLEKIAQLEALSLDGSLFIRRDYLSLRDFSVGIAPQVQGRVNPFAPIGQ